MLVGHALGLDDVQLVCNEKAGVLSSQLQEVEALALRRLAGEPVARILGFKEFYGLAFELNEATLVPRPETEMLVARGIEILDALAQPQFLELGVGSGCIAISMLAHLKTAKALGVDVSEIALTAAKENALRHGIAAQIELKRGSWFEPLIKGQKFDLIVSNPPYIATNIIAGLQKDVRNFDPPVALDGGEDGLVAYTEIISDAREWLKPGGVILLEIGFDQGLSVSALCRRAGFSEVKLSKDLAGQPRMIEAKRD